MDYQRLTSLWMNAAEVEKKTAKTESADQIKKQEKT
jgi:hypothetical protein